MTQQKGQGKSSQMSTNINKNYKWRVAIKICAFKLLYYHFCFAFLKYDHFEILFKVRIESARSLKLGIFFGL